LECPDLLTLQASQLSSLNSRTVGRSVHFNGLCFGSKYSFWFSHLKKLVPIFPLFFVKNLTEECVPWFEKNLKQ
jgi:hypothetical protein